MRRVHALAVLEEMGRGTKQKVSQWAQAQLEAVSWWLHDTSMF